MRSNCYWKLKQQMDQMKKTISTISGLDISQDLINKVNDLETAINENTQNDATLSEKVDNLESGLNQNTQNDAEINDRVTVIEQTTAGESLSDDDIQSLFP